MPKTRLSYKNQRERSVLNSAKARARWERYHAEQEARLPDPQYPDPYMSWGIINYMTGKTHLITLHLIFKRDGRPKARTFEIKDNGKYWFTGSRTEATRRMIKRYPPLGAYNG